MRKSWRIRSRNVFVKLCESAQQASVEWDASKFIEQAGEIARTAALHRRISRFLVFELVNGTLLYEKPEEDRVTKALQLLSSIHSVPLPEGLANHYHGDSLRNRLKQEVEFIKQWPGIDDITLNVVFDSINLPGLSRDSLGKFPAVVGHGDYRAGNLICTPGGEIVPVDWVDLGLCDPRYEWAHFLNSLDNRVESGSGIDRFGDLAGQILAPQTERAAFEDELRLGAIIDDIICAGSKARDVKKYSMNARRVIEFNRHIGRLVSMMG